MLRDEWPKHADGTDFDGQHLMTLMYNGASPFQDIWDVNLLIQEIETKLDTKVVDIPTVSGGSNNYGFHLVLSDRSNIITRLARGDVNTPGFDGFPIHAQILEVKFEAQIYNLLKQNAQIPLSRLFYFRVPEVYPKPGNEPPTDLTGRRLMIFEKTEGECGIWKTLDPLQKKDLLQCAATIRANLFKFNLPDGFVREWLLERLLEQKPTSFSAPISPTREFCIVLLEDKVNATIKNIGDMIGWESDNVTVGPIAAAARQSLLRFIPDMVPKGDHPFLYRFVLEHGDFGIHNSVITTKGDDKGRPSITSLFDWETSCIVPAILSDPSMAVTVDLISDSDAAPSISRLDSDETQKDLEKYMSWSKEYFQTLYDQAPEYKTAIQLGKDVRRLWFALRDWRGADPEGYFGKLGTWAEERMKEMNLS